MTDYDRVAGAYRMPKLKQWEREGKVRCVEDGGSGMSPYDIVSVYVGDQFMGRETNTWDFPSQELFAKVALAVEAGVWK